MRELAGIFRALADETRLQMTGLLLRRREICVCDFVDVLGITQSKASRHLRYLRHAGLVDDRRAGLWVYYRLAREPGPEPRIVVRNLRAILGRQRLQDLQARLERSLERKTASGGVCGMVPPRRRAGREGAVR